MRSACWIIIIMLLVISAAGYLYYLAMRDFWDTGLQDACPPRYVSDRPDLTMKGELPVSSNEDFAKFMTVCGLQFEDALDLHLVRAKYGLLARFNLSIEDMKVFLKNKKCVGKPLLPEAIYGNPNEKLKFNGFHQLTSYSEFPYNKLTWWPITKVEYAQMEKWTGIANWDSPRETRKAKRIYNVFVNRSTSVVYLLD